MIKKLVLFSLLIFLLFIINGCTVMAHDMVISDYPELAETIDNQKPLKAGYGRMVVYYPRLDLEGFAIGGPGGFNYVPLVIEGEKCDVKFLIIDETGVSFDIPAGQYLVHDEDVSKDIKVEIISGETHYIKIRSNPGMFNKKPPVEVSQSEAMKQIKSGKIKTQVIEPEIMPVYKKGYKLIPQNKPPDPKQEKIFVFRDSGWIGAVVPIRIGLNGEPHIDLKNKRYVCIEVRPGIYGVTTAFKRGLGGKKDVYRVGRKVKVKNGQNVYMVIKHIEDIQKVYLINKKDAQKYQKICKQTQNVTFKPVF